ncbi:MFS transporter [Mycolicibacterium sp. P1-18]|uniref:MFS transporter n=1 Tax=Mycolicibacterium sp. P1-18 TaxID=2024615 RepID=UPI0011F0C68E|nr:MFS transporter [Mycolicibacterium sp. P1-18]KAA0098779.1 MFS transporter [Mycolicibacterium sp. P1-18]
MSEPVTPPDATELGPSGIRHQLPLYAAGFVTAFGAHGIAANLGGYTQGQHASLLTLGLLLAVYDGAEVALKPVFGALADRVGARPVLLGGLLAFAAASAAFVIAGDPAWVGLARFGQGAAAAAFSPAAGVLVSRLTPPGAQGRGFGRYGAWKGLGYTLGPLLGGGLIAIGGYDLLFATLAVLAVAVAAWATAMVPGVAPLPRTRQTVADLARRLSSPGFVRPTLALAAATGALSVGVGFLPVIGAERGLGVLVTGAVVSLLALSAAVIQPRAGRARDDGRLSDRAGLVTGLVLTAAGCTAVLIPGIAGLITAAILIGAGVGLITPLGFAALAASSPKERLGQTMGSAEVGRELGDAGGPLLVGALAAAVTLTPALVGFAGVLAAVASVLAAPN